MRADIMRWVTSHMTARDAALLVLTSDREISSSFEKFSHGKGRSVASLKTYNPKITHDTMARLVKANLVEQVGFLFRLKNSLGERKYLSVGEKNPLCERDVTDVD